MTKPNAPPPPSSTSASSSPSYDELARKNVPLPDSSHRPTRAEETDAEEPRIPAVTADDGSGDDAVRAALAGLEHVDVSDLTVALSGGTATLSGSVARRLDRERIMSALARIPGVSEVVDRLRIRTE